MISANAARSSTRIGRTSGVLTTRGWRTSARRSPQWVYFSRTSSVAGIQPLWTSRTSVPSGASVKRTSSTVASSSGCPSQNSWV